jgi:Domain of unknown function (DUF4062)
MARPRVFVSSTFYDLKQVRADLSYFIRELGYEPVLNEHGAVPYSGMEKLEEAAYKEVQLSDMLVSIIGGRFGADANEPPYSISQMELKTALEQGKQVFIFIEQAVKSEYETYLLNKDNLEIKYHSVDSTKIFEFIEEILALPMNNATAGFETAHDIISYLREQWAGLFQRFLGDQGLLREARVIEGMQATVETLNQLVTFLTEERAKGDSAIREILMSNHPAFQDIKKAAGIPYRVYFSNKKELQALLQARGWEPVPQEHWDSPDHEEWLLNRPDDSYWLLKIATRIWERNGRLKVSTPDDWRDSWIIRETRTSEPTPSADFGGADDDIPF